MTTPTSAVATPEHSQNHTLQTLTGERINRIDRLTRSAWKALAHDSATPDLSRSLSRKALLEANRLARDLRRAARISSPEPAWIGPARQKLMVARMELGELRHHRMRTHRSDPAGARPADKDPQN